MRRFGSHLLLSFMILTLASVQLQAGRSLETESSQIFNQQSLKIDVGIEYFELLTEIWNCPPPARPRVDRTGIYPTRKGAMNRAATCSASKSSLFEKLEK